MHTPDPAPNVPVDAARCPHTAKMACTLALYGLLTFMPAVCPLIVEHDDLGSFASTAPSLELLYL